MGMGKMVEIHSITYFLINNNKRVHVKDLDDDQMKKVFVKSLLQKLISLSFRTRIAEAVPAELHDLMPAEPTVFYRYFLLKQYKC